MIVTRLKGQFDIVGNGVIADLGPKREGGGMKQELAGSHRCPYLMQIKALDHGWWRLSRYNSGFTLFNEVKYEQINFRVTAVEAWS